jgi:protein-export membrane protein SecD/preprotein translocase SecF subunit
VAGSSIIDANSGVDQYGSPKVSISLDSKGGAKMLNFTKRAVGKPMAVVFIEFKTNGERDAENKLIFIEERRVISVATINGVFGNQFETTGLDSPQEAYDLALLLRAGALIAPIQIIEERTVGPSLGQENIDLGTKAIMYGFIAVLIFMLIYYKKFGFVANIALTLNLVMIIGVMSMIPGATLTLPGMAGIVLTVGMAVDANVLIFERIREEILDGRSPQQAIHHGYDSAFSTILDANITTFLVGLILFAVGTGPIKGFSITLMIGIITSMFTAIIVTLVIVNAWWGGKRLTKLSIEEHHMQLLNMKNTIAFMALKKPAAILSVFLLIGSLTSLAINQLNWGLDFTGGTQIEVGYAQTADLAQIRKQLEASDFKDAVVQNFGSSQDVLIRLASREGVKPSELGDAAIKVLKEADSSAEMRGSSYVSSSVGDELTEQGGLAMLVALICILIYVALRFEWRFALGSVAALTHDVIITLGLFSILGLEFDLTVLAAVLAVIGYSLNDTIVVCDRIRENFRKIRKSESEEIINISLTQTLNRTIITSLTTILVLLALFFVGGATIHGFATALLFGVIIGTYSSIYVASLVALTLGISKEDLMPTEIEKEGADQDAVV